jgi:hypothetical protein
VCELYSVPNPAKLDSDEVSEENCCQKTCEGHVCPEGKALVKSNLESTAVSEESCCEEICFGFKCPAKFRNNPATATCAAQNKAKQPHCSALNNSPLNTDACCLKTCASFPCQKGQELNPAKLDSIGDSALICCKDILKPVTDIVKKRTAESGFFPTKTCEAKCCCKDMQCRIACKDRLMTIVMGIPIKQGGCGELGHGWHSYERRSENEAANNECEIPVLEYNKHFDEAVEGEL